MAATMRGFLKLNTGLANNTVIRNSFFNSYRFLYSEKTLGIPSYENARLNFRNQFANVESTFRSKMNEVCNIETGMIFTEDLKSMLHLAQKKPEDIELIIKMMTKFNNQDKEMRFGNFIFGPVVMRTLYYLDEPDVALIAFKDPQLENFFDQLASYQILLSLLYKHNKYAEMRDVYDIIQKKNFINNNEPRNALLLVMAACYKENTPETLEYAVNIWKELNKKGIVFLRRASTFLAALAINQNAPHIAIEILSSIKESRYIDVRCMKVAAYMHLKKFPEIVPIIRTSLEHERPNSVKECYFTDVIENLEETMMKENIDEDFELFKLIDLLKKNNHILSQTLENHLCAEIAVYMRKRKQKMHLQTEQFQPQRQWQIPTERNNRRPVLQDLL